MTTLSARFVQTPNERKRYLLDYTLDLSGGEIVTGMGTPLVVAAPGQSDSSAPTLVINGVVLAPGGLQVAFFASGGVDGGNYEVQFLATTSVGQIREDVVEFDIRGDL